jgi:hypothetical protein
VKPDDNSRGHGSQPFACTPVEDTVFMPDSPCASADAGPFIPALVPASAACTAGAALPPRSAATVPAPASNAPGYSPGIPSVSDDRNTSVLITVNLIGPNALVGSHAILCEGPAPENYAASSKSRSRNIDVFHFRNFVMPPPFLSPLLCKLPASHMQKTGHSREACISQLLAQPPHQPEHLAIRAESGRRAGRDISERCCLPTSWLQLNGVGLPHVPG